MGVHLSIPSRTRRRIVFLMLACMAISFVMGIGTASTGVLEKVVLLGFISGCVYAAAKVTTLSEWTVHRLEHR